MILSNLLSFSPVCVCYFVYVKAELVDYVKFEAIVFYIYIAVVVDNIKFECSPRMSSTL